MPSAATEALRPQRDLRLMWAATFAFLVLLAGVLVWSYVALHEQATRFNALQLGALSLLGLVFGVLAFISLRRLGVQEAERERTRQALEAARDQAEEASRAKSQFLARMSHELRTPLNAVLGLSQVMRSAPGALDSGQRLHLQTIEQAGRHLLALIDDTLDLARIESGELRVERVAVNLASTVAAVRLALAPLAAGAGVTVQPAVQLEANEPWVWADAVRVRQVLLNLVSNAIKYNRTGGSVRVVFELVDAHWAVHVIDDGKGLSAQQMAHLFEPYNRLGAENSRVPGTGIGLAIARSMVGLMGGRLSADSTVGQGTRFTLELSALAAAEAHDAGPVTDFGTLAPSARGQGASLLYVEDNEVNVVVFEACLARRPGVALHVARDGAQALELVQSVRFDLLVLDLNLPDTNGFDLLAALRAESVAAPAALLTADAMPATAERARACGFDAVWTKPVDPGRLLGQIDRLLEEHAGVGAY